MVESSKRQGRPASILVVDDDDLVRNVTGSILDRLSHNVTLVRTAEEALEQFVPGRFDLALIDLGLPGTPGHSVAEQLRRVDPLLATVLFTGFLGAEARRDS